MDIRWLRVHALAVAALAGALAAPVDSALADQGQKTGKNPPSKAAASKSNPAPAVPELDAEIKAAIAAAPKASEWPNSNYARLLDLGNVTVKSDGTIIAKYRLTYKLFNERAQSLAEVNLPYNNSYQEIHVLSARTIKKNGTVVDVKPEDIRTVALAKDALMYDDAQGIGFSMPGVEDDCIIDYTWEEITRPLLMPGQFWTYWGFSGAEPVGISRYVLKAPADKKINYKVYNDESLKPTIVNSVDGKFKTYTWERKNLNPIDIEPFMPRLSEVTSWMEVSSLDSWQDVAKWFWNLQKPQARSTDAIKTTVSELIKDKATDEEKARAIYDWVANRTRYVGLEFGLSAYQPHPAADVHDKRYGDCKDKANLLITMLGLAGIKARPVLLHADERRLVDQGLPTLNAFNHCIALADVGGKDVWLDATAETCAYGDIPYSDRGVEALVVGEGKGEFKTIPPYQPAENGVDVSSKITVNPDGSAIMQTEITMRGEAGQSLRATVRSLTPDQRKVMMQTMGQRFSNNATLKDYTLPDGQDKSGPFTMKLTILAPNFAKKTKKTGSLLFLPLSGFGSGEQPNPYIKEKRVWPIIEEDASQTRSETLLTLPEGFVIEDVPGDIKLSSPIQQYRRTLTKSADSKTITISSEIVEHPGKVLPADYEKVKTYYTEVSQSAGDQIVLKKAK